ncbi:MAG: DUF6531 domain-containing protein, partial [Candidatus Omnitrophica bacterium]|nr:DUF6531 domain-containing protein [Candidatus Omnitrophota bacterium]
SQHRLYLLDERVQIARRAYFEGRRLPPEWVLGEYVLGEIYGNYFVLNTLNEFGQRPKYLFSFENNKLTVEQVGWIKDEIKDIKLVVSEQVSKNYRVKIVEEYKLNGVLKRIFILDSQGNEIGEIFPIDMDTTFNSNIAGEVAMNFYLILPIFSSEVENKDYSFEKIIYYLDNNYFIRADWGIVGYVFRIGSHIIKYNGRIINCVILQELRKKDNQIIKRYFGIDLDNSEERFYYHINPHGFGELEFRVSPEISYYYFIEDIVTKEGIVFETPSAISSVLKRGIIADKEYTLIERKNLSKSYIDHFGEKEFFVVVHDKKTTFTIPLDLENLQLFDEKGILRKFPNLESLADAIEKGNLSREDIKVVKKEIERETSQKIDPWQLTKSEIILSIKIALGFIVGYIGMTLVIGKIFAWLGQLNRIKNKNIPDKNIKIKNLTSDEIEKVMEEIQNYPTYNFPENIVRLVKERILKPQIKAKLERGEQLDDFIEEFFFDYIYGWLKPVMQIEEKTLLFGLDDVYLYSLTTLGSANFSHISFNFKNYLFYCAKKLKEERKEDQIWPFIEKEVIRWVNVIHKNEKSNGKKFGKYSRLLFDDIDDYFRSKEFISWYEGQGRLKIDDYLKDEQPKTVLNEYLQKSYPDICGGLFGWKSWLLILRNYYKFIFILGLYSFLPSFIIFPLALYLNFVGFYLFFSLLIYAGIKLALKKTQNKYTGKYKPVPEQEGYLRNLDKIKKFWPNLTSYKIKSSLIILIIIGQKVFWNALIWRSIGVSIVSFWNFYYLVSSLDYFLLGISFLVFLSFFMLDIFAFFYLTEASLGYILGKYRGVSRVRKWNESLFEKILNFPIRLIFRGKLEGFFGDSVVSKFNDAMREFQRKLLPAEIVGIDGARRLWDKNEENEEEIKIAQAKAWNMIIEQFYHDDLISEDELKSYRYQIKEDPYNYLGGVILKYPNLSKPPKNEHVRRRLFFFFSTLLMPIQKMPIWEKLYLFSVITPCFEEVIIYPFTDESFGEFEGLNQEFKTGATLLTYIITRYPQEWKNFIARIKRMKRGEKEAFCPEISSDEIEAFKTISQEEIDKLENLTYGQKLNITNPLLIMEVRLWASYRYQPLARTIRGIMNYWQMYEFLAKVNFPTSESLGLEKTQLEEYTARIQKLVEEKFEYIVGFQIYSREKERIEVFEKQNSGKVSNREYTEAKFRLYDLYYLMKRFKHFKVAYLVDLKNPAISKGESNWYGGLLEYRQGLLQPQERFEHTFEEDNPNKPRVVEVERIYLPVHYYFGQGKPVNQNNILRFVRGEIVQFVDMNQDMYLEETFKGPCMAEEFRLDKQVVMVGFPEDIFTETATFVGKMHAFANRVFTTLLQRFLDWLGIRLHYGHPDYLRTDAVRQLGFIIPTWVNEDIFAAYKALLYGKKIINKEIMQAGKAREGTYNGLLGIHMKFAAGNIEQAMSRWIYRFNNSKIVGSSRAFLHFIGATGFYLRKAPVVITITGYLLIILISCVASFGLLPSRLFLSIIGTVFISFAISFTGYFQLILEKGFIKGTKEFIEMFLGLALVFGSQIYNAYFCGVMEAVKGGAKYIKTGRLWAREHKAPFLPITQEEAERDPNARELYQWINRKGMPWVVIGILLSILTIYFGAGLNILWSLPFILIPFFSLLAIFLVNPGATPLAIGWKRWFKNQVEDTFNCLKKNWHWKLPYKTYFSLIIISILGFLFFEPFHPILAKVWNFLGIFEFAHNFRWLSLAVFVGLYLGWHWFRESTNLLFSSIIVMTTLWLSGIILEIAINLPLTLGLRLRDKISSKIYYFMVITLLIGATNLIIAQFYNFLLNLFTYLTWTLPQFLLSPLTNFLIIFGLGIFIISVISVTFVFFSNNPIPYHILTWLAIQISIFNLLFMNGFSLELIFGIILFLGSFFKGLLAKDITYVKIALAERGFLDSSLSKILIHTFPATMPATNLPDRPATSEELKEIILSFGKGAKALQRQGISSKNRVIFSDRILPSGKLLPKKLDKNSHLTRAPPKQRAVCALIDGVLYLHHNFLKIPLKQRKIFLEGHELFHLLNPKASETEAFNFTLSYLFEHNLLEKHLELLRKNNPLGLRGNRAWLAYLKNKKDFNSCASLVLEKVFDKLGIAKKKQKVLLEELNLLALRNRGMNSLWEIKVILQRLGIKTIALKVKLEDLENIISTNTLIIANLTGNHHFSLIEKVEGNNLLVYIPNLNQEYLKIPFDFLRDNWDGIILLVGSFDFDKNKNYKIVSDKELKTILGGQPCDNITSCSGEHKGPKGLVRWSMGNGPAENLSPSSNARAATTTSEPVNIQNGNLFLEAEDIFVPTCSLPLNLTRYYNSQVTSVVSGWLPEAGAGSWRIENGEYSGEGDRSTSNLKFLDFTLELDMQTIKPGGHHSWETAWINFRYTEDTKIPRKPKDCYYFLIHTDGRIELAKYKDGVQYFLFNKKTSYKAEDKHHIKIVVSGINIKVYIDRFLEINYFDGDPLLKPGRIALEAYFCHAHFSNLKITSEGKTYEYPFNFDDNEFIFGYGWTHSYSLRIKELPTHLILYRENNHKEIYIPKDDGTYFSIPTNYYQDLTKDKEGFSLRTKYGIHYRFNLDGRLIYVEDRNKNRITLGYSKIHGKFLLTSITEPTGRKITLEYGENNMVSRAYDPEGNFIQYFYDENNHLVKVIDRRGIITQYRYDPINNSLTQLIAPEGTYSYTYSYNNRVKTQTDPNGSVTTFDYLWDTVHIINSRNEVYKYNFDKFGFLQSVVDPNGNMERTVNDENGNILEYYDKNNLKYQFFYDDEGNLIKIKEPDRVVREFTYDKKFGQITSLTDPNGNKTFFKYDENGNIIEIIDAEGNKTIFTYGQFGQLIFISNPKKGLIKFEYDNWRNLAKIIDAEGNSIEYTYDILGRLIKIKDASENFISYSYDKNGNLISIKDAQENTITFIYNDKGELIEIKDPLGNTTKYTYDCFGNLTSVTDPKGNTTNYTYDTVNFLHLGFANLLSIKDPKGGTTEFFYDALGQLSKIVDSFGHTYQFSYDNVGNITTKKDPRGKSTYYEYIPSGKLQHILYSDFNFTNYTFDLAENIIQIEDISGRRRLYYDKLNRLTKLIYPDGVTLDYSYDEIGNRTALEISDFGKIHYEYDELSR